ncbi:MAG: acyl-CoA dehydrogenase family protein [Ilumatobacteraceae bacterium]|nr:acyl-CoA dehydrogenase family protein [Ilumatobacteraceae bacterium]
MSRWDHVATNVATNVATDDVVRRATRVSFRGTRVRGSKDGSLAGDIDRAAEYSWETFEALKMMELTALSYPEEYGGSGASLVDQAIVAEELARACVSTSLRVMGAVGHGILGG